MGLSDKATTTRGDIISMIGCADTYGHNNQITRGFFWSMLGEELTDEEIHSHAQQIKDSPGYGQEDYDSIRDALNWFRREVTK